MRENAAEALVVVESIFRLIRNSQVSLQNLEKIVPKPGQPEILQCFMKLEARTSLGLIGFEKRNKAAKRGWGQVPSSKLHLHEAQRHRPLSLAAHDGGSQGGRLAQLSLEKGPVVRFLAGQGGGR